MRRPAWGGSRSPPLKLARTPAPRPCRRASRGHQSNVNRPVHWLRGRHEQEQREEPPSGVPFWGGRPRFRTAITAKCQLPVGMPAHTAHTHSQLLPPPPDHGGPEFKKILCQHQRSSPGLNDALHVSVAFLTAQGRRQLPTARRRCGATSRCHPQLRTSHAVPSDCAVSELVSVGVAGPVQRSVHPPRAHVVAHTLQLLSHVVLSGASAGVTVTPPLPARPSLVPSLWLSSRGSAPPPSRTVMMRQRRRQRGVAVGAADIRGGETIFLNPYFDAGAHQRAAAGCRPPQPTTRQDRGQRERGPTMGPMIVLLCDQDNLLETKWVVDLQSRNRP